MCFHPSPTCSTRACVAIYIRRAPTPQVCHKPGVHTVSLVIPEPPPSPTAAAAAAARRRRRRPGWQKATGHCCSLHQFQCCKRGPDQQPDRPLTPPLQALCQTGRPVCLPWVAGCVAVQTSRNESGAAARRQRAMPLLRSRCCSAARQKGVLASWLPVGGARFPRKAREKYEMGRRLAHGRGYAGRSSAPLEPKSSPNESLNQ